VAEIKKNDLLALGEMVNNDKNELKKLLGMFLETTPPALSEMESLLQDKNYQKISKLVHKMKPSVTLMKMKELIPLMPDIENYESVPVVELEGDIRKYILLMSEVVELIKKEIQ
jgi:HPt (histidine-containing phosphotransfer) domain-containing protein